MGSDQQGVRAAFAAAAHGFAELVDRIPPDAWTRPGLGEWDVRSLVGHTARSLITVRTYLKTPAPRADLAGPQEYYLRVNPTVLGLDPADVVERGRQAGRDLGDDPAAAVRELVTATLADLDGVDDPLIEVIGGLGIRLNAYLPTRVFEMAVYSLDIARALGIDFSLPPEVLTKALTLAVRIAAAGGQGEQVLLALTGREPLAAGFSLV